MIERDDDGQCLCPLCCENGHCACAECDEPCECEYNCEFCGELSATPMCDHCAEADEAGVLDKYLAGEVPCPACAKM